MKEAPRTPSSQLHIVFQESGEKESVAGQFGIIGDGLKRMEKRSDGWYMDNMPIAEYKEKMDELYAKDVNYGNN